MSVPETLTQPEARYRELHQQFIGKSLEYFRYKSVVVRSNFMDGAAIYNATQAMDAIDTVLDHAVDEGLVEGWRLYPHSK